jgi:hypothetical protein
MNITSRTLDIKQKLYFLHYDDIIKKINNWKNEFKLSQANRFIS